VNVPIELASKLIGPVAVIRTALDLHDDGVVLGEQSIAEIRRLLDMIQTMRKPYPGVELPQSINATIERATKLVAS
jgi:hypothetical protein